jgi:hypothetical protein
VLEPEFHILNHLFFCNKKEVAVVFKIICYNEKTKKEKLMVLNNKTNSLIEIISYNFVSDDKLYTLLAMANTISIYKYASPLFRSDFLFKDLKFLIKDYRGV